MMSRKALSGKKTAKKNDVPALPPRDGNEGLGSGLLEKAAEGIKKNKNKRQAEIDKIMKDLN